jgi:ferredoxin
LSTSVLAMGIALFAVLNLVIGLAVLSMLTGAFETFFGKPKLSLLRPTKGASFFAFGFRWNSAKENIAIDSVKIRLFNPFGSPTQSEVYKSFPLQKKSFAMEVDFGPGLVSLLGAKGFEQSVIQVEVGSARDGVVFQFDMKGPKFKQLVNQSELTPAQFVTKYKLDEEVVSQPPIEIPSRSFIADTVPGKGAQLKIATNPLYAAEFGAAVTSAGASTSATAQAVANFAVLKVWIEPGCIVCNACEDIYPEVFDVQADTCIIRPGAPLDDGLKIQEAAEACPVEVIKFNKAS